MASNPFREIPAVHDLLETPALSHLSRVAGREVVVQAARGVLDELRGELRRGACAVPPPAAELVERIALRVTESAQAALRPVINATGILLHTGLGRAPLAEEAIREVVAVARDYANVELDLASGGRGRRTEAVDGLLRELTGAEAALVVNNNAGATMLALAALASGREVLVSRGQLIEIGGSYRLPDVMAASGAVLREVGTTNKTRVDDYARAIGPQTAAILLVHPSSFAIVGFAESAPLGELVELGQRRQLPVIHDIGSGALIDFAQFGFHGEPVASESLQAGADLVLFSGDKLLGGPQCGILLGRRPLVERIEAHPMARALRVGKLTLAALAATLRLYRDPRRAQSAVPLLRLLTTPLSELRERAETLASQFSKAPALAEAEAVEETAFLGGGSIPAQELPTWCVAVRPRALSLDRLAALLRQGKPPVVGRTKKDRFLFDLRTVSPRQDPDLLATVSALGPAEQ
jgi:L-seryl-tRNA(Ser) seleniumtransferase